MGLGVGRSVDKKSELFFGNTLAGLGGDATGNLELVNMRVQHVFHKHSLSKRFGLPDGALQDKRLAAKANNSYIVLAVGV